MENFISTSVISVNDNLYHVGELKKEQKDDDKNLTEMFTNKYK